MGSRTGGGGRHIRKRARRSTGSPRSQANLDWPVTCSPRADNLARAPRTMGSGPIWPQRWLAGRSVMTVSIGQVHSASGAAADFAAHTCYKDEIGKVACRDRAGHDGEGQVETGKR